MLYFSIRHLIYFVTFSVNIIENIIFRSQPLLGAIFVALSKVLTRVQLRTSSSFYVLNVKRK